MAEQKRISLEGRKLFIGIPAYDGKLNIKTAFTIAQLMIFPIFPIAPLSLWRATP